MYIEALVLLGFSALRAIRSPNSRTFSTDIQIHGNTAVSVSARR